MIGGGIGGLTAGVALNQAGIDADVYERVPVLREVGAGISLWANAIRALDALGLSRGLCSRGISGWQGALRKPDGRVLQEVSYAEIAQRGGDVLVVMHRADLLALLSQALAPQRLHLNSECVGVEQNAGGVTVRFANGETADADVLIGADGLHSTVRAHLFGAAPPRYAGYTAWRAIATVERTELRPGETWGAGRRFGIVPLADGRVYWFATENVPAGEPNIRPKETLLSLFRGWHEPIEALIHATDEAAILRNDIYDRPPLRRWSQGRVTLLGDAAHPMTPNLGQGGCQAIEDAVVLAVCVRNAGTVEGALRSYEQRRIPRTSGIVLQSRRMGALGQWENAALRWLRDSAVRAVPQHLAARQLEPIAGFDCLTAEEREVFAHS